MNKMSGETVDFTSNNIEKLKELFPEIISEGEKINFDKLKTIMGNAVDDQKERYNFTWHGKKQSMLGAQKPSKGTLRPDREKSKNFDTTENLYIEGDNLETLKLLQKSYNNKVKVVYIDPPYNTGNDFVYKDNFKEGIDNYLEQTGQIDSEGNQLSTNSESQGRYHSNWLNMMYPRLKLARNLLTDDGVIFISIDDNEFTNLKKVCDEIYGSKNFLGSFVINSTPNARDYGHIGKMHDYMLLYSKDYTKAKTNKLPELDKQFKYSDQISGFNIHPLYNSNEAFNKNNRPNLFYPIYLYTDKRIDNSFFEIGLEKRKNSIEIYPPKSLKNKVQFVWRWGREKTVKNLNEEIVGLNNSYFDFKPSETA